MRYTRYSLQTKTCISQNKSKIFTKCYVQSNKKTIKTYTYVWLCYNKSNVLTTWKVIRLYYRRHADWCLITSEVNHAIAIICIKAFKTFKNFDKTNTNYEIHIYIQICRNNRILRYRFDIYITIQAFFLLT